MPSLSHYMAQYDHEHTSGWNKLLHGIGIPLIFVGLVLLVFTKWIGRCLFYRRLGVLLLGHKLEGNHPAFFQDRFTCWLGQSGWQKRRGTL